MGSDDGTWFELRPDGERVDGAESYRRKAEAEQAATAMLIRRPELQFVEITEREVRGGTASGPGSVRRIAGTRPPVPSQAQVDDLHKLPRGDPEC